MKCLSNIELTEFLDNQTDAGEIESISKHLRSCFSCCSRLENLKKEFQLMEQMKEFLNPTCYPEPSFESIPFKRSIKKSWRSLIPSFKGLRLRPVYTTALVIGMGILLLSLWITQKSNIDRELSGPSSAQTMPKILILQTDGVPSDSIIFPDKTKSRLIVWVCKTKREI